MALPINPFPKPFPQELLYKLQTFLLGTGVPIVLGLEYHPENFVTRREELEKIALEIQEAFGATFQRICAHLLPHLPPHAQITAQKIQALINGFPQPLPPVQDRLAHLQLLRTAQRDGLAIVTEALQDLSDQDRKALWDAVSTILALPREERRLLTLLFISLIPEHSGDIYQWGQTPGAQNLQGAFLQAARAGDTRVLVRLLQQELFSAEIVHYAIIEAAKAQQWTALSTLLSLGYALQDTLNTVLIDHLYGTLKFSAIFSLTTLQEKIAVFTRFLQRNAAIQQQTARLIVPGWNIPEASLSHFIGYLLHFQSWDAMTTLLGNFPPETQRAMLVPHIRNLPIDILRNNLPILLPPARGIWAYLPNFLRALWLREWRLALRLGISWISFGRL